MTIQTLVTRFHEQISSYQQPSYNETQTRNDFINPFFQVLGWDVNNQQGLSEKYRHVLHEDTLKIKGVIKKPDYTFCVSGVRKFFVEAKKPSISLKNNKEAAFQIRRYGWSAKLPLSIITNFREFAVYDCSVKPSPTDSADIARLKYLTYTEFVNQWEYLASTFSYDSVWQGQLDQYAQNNATKGMLKVDAAFLEEIEHWRVVLAQHIAAKNTHLNQRQLNFVVQQTIDRIIFLRICEDRGIEEYERLLKQTYHSDVYTRLFQLFREADQRYNSGLFHFKSEKGRDEPDELSFSLNISDDILATIIKNLYYPNSPYEFSVLPTDILGQIYEQFLGKVIRIDSNRQVEIEEKLEVKKAGGVYYTPSYIVEYIVKNTLEPLLMGKKLNHRNALNTLTLRVLDPSCGSGSFLLGAYQFLLDWHLEQYLQDPTYWAKGKKPSIYQATGGTWRLTIEERKRILLNTIFGVDIDPQAVEVTKLSLLLKVLEDEQSVISQLTFATFRERVLPDLDNNIKCGNSLIDSNFYRGQQSSWLDEETRYRINAFDWHTEFSEQFDAVIGNPPYIRTQSLKKWFPLEVDFYKTHYISAAKGNYDIYLLFIEKGLNLLKSNGRLGFILPHKFFNANYGEPLRNLLAMGQHISEIIHFGDCQIFPTVTTYTCLFFLSQQPQEYFKFNKLNILDDLQKFLAPETITLSSKQLHGDKWHFLVGTAEKLMQRLNDLPVKLENVTCRIFQGIKTGADKVYIATVVQKKAQLIQIYSEKTQRHYWVETDLFHPLIKGGDSQRFFISKTQKVILFPYQVQSGGHAELINDKIFGESYPKTWDYLMAHREALEQREGGKITGEQWYKYSRHQALDVIALPKIFTPDIAKHAAFSLDDTGELFFTGGAAGGYGILPLPEYSTKYLLGLLNSKLLEWFIRQTSTVMRGGYYSYESRFIRKIPIYPIDSNDSTAEYLPNQLVQHVEHLFFINQQIAAAKDSHTKKNLSRQLDSLEQQINHLVYQLYHLTDEEILEVEKSFAEQP